MIKFSVELASVPDRENIVAEIWYGEDQVAEVRREATGVLVQVYPPPRTKWWEFVYDDFLTALEKAKQSVQVY